MSRDLRDILEDVRARYGKLTPETVLIDARSPESELHSRFDWDVERAAERHWIDEARRLIKSVRVTFVDEEIHDIPRYVSVQRATGPQYEPIESVALDPVASMVVLNEAKRQWVLFKRRYGHIVAVMDQIQAELSERAS